MRFFSLLAVLVLLFAACGKERVELLLQPLTVTSSGDKLWDLHFSDAQNGTVVGGKRYDYGLVCHTTDAGQNWQCDSLWDEIVAYDEAPGIQACVAYQGRCFARYLPTDSWAEQQPPDVGFLNGVAVRQASQVLVLGGVNYQQGRSWFYDNVLSGTPLSQVGPLFHELVDAQYINDSLVFSVGYGWLARSSDAGQTWQALDVQGDYFRAIHFPSPSVGYVVGYEGTILKTEDGGEHWKKLRNGNNLFSSNVQFRDVYFRDEQQGYVVGNAGLFWRTDDGGKTWQVVENTPDVDFSAVQYVGGRGYITAFDGRVWWF